MSGKTGSKLLLLISVILVDQSLLGCLFCLMRLELIRFDDIINH